MKTPRDDGGQTDGGCRHTAGPPATPAGGRGRTDDPPLAPEDARPPTPPRGTSGAGAAEHQLLVVAPARGPPGPPQRGAKRVFICKTSPQLSSCPIVLRMVLAPSCWCQARLLHPRDRRAPGCPHLGLSGPEWEPWPHYAPLGRDGLSLGLYVGSTDAASHSP